MNATTSFLVASAAEVRILYCEQVATKRIQSRRDHVPVLDRRRGFLLAGMMMFIVGVCAGFVLLGAKKKGFEKWCDGGKGGAASKKVALPFS